MLYVLLSFVAWRIHCQLPEQKETERMVSERYHQ